MSKLIFILIGILSINFLFAQSFINEKEFDKKISEDIVVIEFWAEWNDENKFQELSKLNECYIYRVDVNNNTSLQKAYKISSLPTLIIFNNGTEHQRFQANIMFQLEATKKDIQQIIDKLLLQKFR